jgi:NitT/TauT family transport system permease protein
MARSAVHARVRSLIPPAVALIGLLVLWQVICDFYSVPTWLLPAPSTIAKSAAEWSGLLPQHAYATAYVTAIGFAAAAVVGFAIAIALTASPFFMRTAYPLLLSLQSMPKIAIAPLLLMWVGFGPASKIIIVFLVCFFPIVVSGVAGLNAVPSALIDLARSFSTPWWRVYTKIRIPYSLPHLFVGLKVAITLAVTGAVVGEFVASKEGLGFLILNGVQQFNTPLAFAAMVLLGFLTILFYGVVALAEMILLRWKPMGNYAS